MEVLGDNDIMDIRMSREDPHLWVETPEGLVKIFIGNSGRLHITLWSPHDKKITKKSHRGKMQVTTLRCD